MSRLRIYWPESRHADHQVDANEGPVTLSFKCDVRSRVNSKVADLISRARLLYQNKRCPHCSHPVIEPIELANAVLNRNRMPIPGTATLVGFRCGCCQAEWPASP
jgi:hypothetical protein